MHNQFSDAHTRKCSALNARGEPCGSYALRDSGPPLCTYHAMSEAERAQWTARGGNARARNVRKRHEVEKRLEGIAYGVTTEHILKVCLDALDATFEHDGSPDWGARLSACSVLLQVFPASLRKTPEQARTLLHDLLDGTKHAALARREVAEHFKAQRREWLDISMRCSSLGKLYYEAFPPGLLSPGETAESVKSEVPDLDQWKVERLHDGRGREIDGFVRVVKPNGDKVIVQRDALGQRAVA